MQTAGYTIPKNCHQNQPSVYHSDLLVNYARPAYAGRKGPARGENLGQREWRRGNIIRTRTVLVDCSFTALSRQHMEHSASVVLGRVAAVVLQNLLLNLACRVHERESPHGAEVAGACTPPAVLWSDSGP